jgi:hypothetical protein
MRPRQAAGDASWDNENFGGQAWLDAVAAHSSFGHACQDRDTSSRKFMLSEGSRPGGPTVLAPMRTQRQNNPHERHSLLKMSPRRQRKAHEFR